ncbi:MAG: MBL fold metallo-hydrolase [Gammaproteobacteria bacterium]|nr:MBL fold metallo-hydrolase [Gammaproteobacteria bacterium]
MNIVDQKFAALEYDLFVEKSLDRVTPEREKELTDLIRKYNDRLSRREVYSRLAALKKEAQNPSTYHEFAYYAKSYGIFGIKRYRSSTGEKIYRLPVLSFNMNDWRDHFTNTYLIVGKELTLIDCGTVLSEQYMHKCFEVVSHYFGENISVADLDNVIITHAHIDHYGGLSFLREQMKPNGRIFAHEDDAETIEDVPGALRKTQTVIKDFLHSAGIQADNLEEMLDMYMSSKKTMKGCPVTDRLTDGMEIIDGYKILHVPGHCSGQINIIVGDVIFLGDQVLMDITPHQFPSFYMKGMGLVHYITSLLKVAAVTKNIRLGLASHNHEVLDVSGRAMEIIDAHHERMADIMSILDEPKTLNQITTEYFQQIEGKIVSGYDSILALEEILAHLEYLEKAMNCVTPIASNDPDDPVLHYQRSY